MKKWAIFLGLLHLPFAAVLLYYALVSPAVGGEGDTLMHFFVAEIAPHKPLEYFSLWGKPFYTLFASLPANLGGFSALKVFNVLCGTAAVLFTSLSARLLGFKLYWTIPLLAFVAPHFPSILLTGLSEPFAALVLSIVVWLFLKEKTIPAYMLASFLPYCRSEAKVILIALIIFGLLQKHYRHLPLLLTGSVLYAVVGSFWKGGLLWIFESPYHPGPSVYGSGSWDHFIVGLFKMTSWPGFLLLVLGLIAGGYYFFSRTPFRRHTAWLIYAPFIAIVAAHSIVWSLGIYASAGLERVLVLVFPLMWLIMLQGLSMLFCWEHFRKWIPHTAAALYIALLATEVYIDNGNTRYFWYQSTRLRAHQKLIKEEIAPFIDAHFPQEGRFYVCDEAYLGIVMDYNPSNYYQHLNWNTWNDEEKLAILKPNTVFLWDSHYPPVHYNITREMLRDSPLLKPVKRWDVAGENRFYELYEFSDELEILRKRFPVDR